MAWKHYQFLCPNEHEFSCLVDDREPTPDPCPTCGATDSKRTVGAFPHSTRFVPMYPGCKAQKAGTGHEARRPAEKKGRQISMAGTSKKGG